MSTRPRGTSTVAAVIVLLAGLVTGCGSGVVHSRRSAEPVRLVFDLRRDFSFTANPNGPWRYGYTRSDELSLAAFAADTVTETAPPVGFWHPGEGREGYYPYVAASPGLTTVLDPTGSWAVRPSEVVLEASQLGEFAAIQFTVPRDGVYAIAADFAGVHRGLSTTDVHVLLADESLFAATIDGYGGDPVLLPRQGASPTASYSDTRALRSGDVLTFGVGFGQNRTHYNDTTGLALTISEVG